MKPKVRHNQNPLVRRALVNRQGLLASSLESGQNYIPAGRQTERIPKGQDCRREPASTKGSSHARAQPLFKNVNISPQVESLLRFEGSALSDSYLTPGSLFLCLGCDSVVMILTL